MGSADVGEMVDRVQRELQRHAEEDRRAPGRAPVGDQQRHAEGQVERRRVAQVVVVLHAERADVGEERVRREDHQRRDREVVDGERDQTDLEHRCATTSGRCSGRRLGGPAARGAAGDDLTSG